jgi:arylsulfatase A-like enzyme
MYRNLAAFVAIALIACSTRAAEIAAPLRRPSVLLIMPDQLRAQSVGCLGSPDIRTPHIDALAKQGVVFRNTFANTPVCCPARAIILTGKYAHKNGMMANDLRLRETETTLAELLSASGYRTGFIGKWHLDGGIRMPGFVPPGPRRQGFQFWAASECNHNHFHPLYFRNTPAPISDDRFEPEVWTDRAIEFLKGVKDTPFFLEVAMGPPHDPYGAPPKFMKQYNPATIAPRPNWTPGVVGAGRKELAAYAAAVTAVDEQVGRLLKTLDDLGRADDTIVIFTSDHGDMLGSQGQRHKRKPWEESIRVPGLIRYPARVAPGRVEDAPLTHVDLAPTILGLCGLPAPSDMQGANLASLVLGRGGPRPNSAFFQIFVPFADDDTADPWRGVRTDQYMYARTQEGPWVLYDLKSDPYEKRNLASDPAYAATRAEMETLLSGWMTRTGDSWAMNSRARVEDKGRLYRFETFTTIDDYLNWEKAHPGLAPKD